MKDDLNVFKGSDGKWQIKREGGERASGVFNTQAKAFERARELARKSSSEVSIHNGTTGKIRDKHSYGSDPYPPKG